MNKIMNENYPLFEMYSALRKQLMPLLNDSDLNTSPGGGNLTLGELCREIGEIESSYIQSFKTFQQDFDYRNRKPGLTGSVSALSSWFEQLDNELKAAVSGLSDDDIAQKVIDRGPEFKVPPQIQLEIYKEALLIFYGKCSVYLKSLGKELPQQWQDWIA